jgi:hypothetical protein
LIQMTKMDQLPIRNRCATDVLGARNCRQDLLLHDLSRRQIRGPRLDSAIGKRLPSPNSGAL